MEETQRSEVLNNAEQLAYRAMLPGLEYGVKVQLSALNSVRAGLGLPELVMTSNVGPAKRGRKPKNAPPADINDGFSMPPRSTGNHGGGYKGISAEGRRSLSEAMKARWAARKAEAAKAAKAAKRAPVNVKEHKGSMSAEGLESFKKAMKKSMTQRNAAARKLGYSNLVDYYRAVKAGTERRSITLTNSKAPKKNAAKKAAKVQHQEKQAA